MRAGVFRGAGRMPIEQVPDPVAGPADVVLEVRACGVCGSDLHAYTQGLFTKPGQIMGHEFAGEVVSVGAEVAGIARGDRVTGLPIQPCGACRRCRESVGHLCEVWNTRSIAFGLPGAFAEQLRIPDAVLGYNVHKLPDAVTFEAGALVEPLAVAVHAVRQAALSPGQSAVVLGLGTIGLQVAQVLMAEGASPVIGVDRSPLRRSIAERLGVTVFADVADVPGDPEIDTVFEVTGAPALVAHAAEIARPRGTVLIVALYEEPAQLDPTRLVHKELTVRGSAMVTPEDFRDAIDLLATGKAQTEPLITHRKPLAELGAAFDAQTDADQAVKVMVVND
ncbi:alcohol dehydrogenase catalytic domain-containing protein [Saccharopolyspora sp. K220]|uniref:zinc-dependent alcohol dehydrogenase n=1 Tax=Saccharopolyspora soli TaxID=2926618 RepID=UPI001F560790|nr:alcohol dehydrogenase catalytic domain-containing protein [Saccharopolyspora soli]MCI2415939.1 alcohol dehydrogenase catalytic domain-containing protein [Saccharopolyspora soli]